MKRVLVVLTVISGCLLTPAARGQAVITWGDGAHNITFADESDVTIAGTLVQAFNVGPSGISSAVIHGVTFDAFGINTESLSNTLTIENSTTFSLHETSTKLTAAAEFGADSGTFSGGASADYRSLLSSAGYASAEAVARFELSIIGLTTGHTYQFQWWLNDASGAEPFSTKASSDIEFVSGVTLSSNTESGSVGGLGQFAIGNFTVSGSTSQVIYFQGLGGVAPHINAFQLRDVTAVPEPATYAGIAGLGALSLAVFRRRRTKGV